MGHRFRLPPQEQCLLREAVEKEKSAGVIRRIAAKKATWISSIFLVEKKGGKRRKIIDNSALNRHLRSTPFHMEDHRILIPLVQPFIFAESADISDAYHHIPVHPSFSPFLCFRFDGECYEYVGMPFGVNLAPHTFTDIMHQCIAFVRKVWPVTVISFIDDLPFLHSDPLRVSEIITFLEWLGWRINYAKSELVPSQRCRSGCWLR
jgi:hypothetical protein